MHDRHQVILKANLEHFVLRWAKKGHQRYNSVKSFQSWTRRFRGEEFWSISVSPPPPRWPCFSTIKISRTHFEKGHPRNNPVKLFQNLTSSFREEFWRISLKSTQWKKPPPHSGHVFRWIKISWTSFEKGHLWKNLAKLFQNLTIGFRGEEFGRISPSPHSAKSLPT